jgi:hypothetical protein
VVNGLFITILLVIIIVLLIIIRVLSNSKFFKKLVNAPLSEVVSLFGCLALAVAISVYEVLRGRTVFWCKVCW